MSNQLLQMKQTQAALKAEARAIYEKATITEKREMTAEEIATFDEKEAKVKALAATIERGEKIASDTAFSDGRAEVIHENALDKPLFGRPPVKGESEKERLTRLAEGFGEQLLSIRSAAENPHAPRDPRLDEVQKRAAFGAGEAVPADGGFLVYPDFSQEIVRIMHDVGLVYTKCRKIPLSDQTNAIKIPGIDEQSRVDGSRWGGVQMFWQNEGDVTTAKRPKFRLIELVTKKLMGLFYATDELLTDARALGGIVMQAFGEEMAFKMDDAVINGDGSGKPQGILNANCLVTVSKESGQATGTVVWENIKKMRGRMWPRSRPDSLWFINVDVEQQFHGMVQNAGTGGIPVFLPAGAGGAQFGGASAEPYDRLYGRPVIPIEQCNTLSSLGDIIYADLSQYALIDKGDMQSAVSMHVRFITDEQTFRWVYRADGQPIWHTALTPFKGSNTLSPFVTLQAR